MYRVVLSRPAGSTFSLAHVRQQAEERSICDGECPEVLTHMDMFYLRLVRARIALGCGSSIWHRILHTLLNAVYVIGIV